MYRGGGMRVEGTYESVGSVGVTVGVVVTQDGGPAITGGDDQRGQLAGSMVCQPVDRTRWPARHPEYVRKRQLHGHRRHIGRAFAAHFFCHRCPDTRGGKPGMPIDNPGGVISACNGRRRRRRGDRLPRKRQLRVGGDDTSDGRAGTTSRDLASSLARSRSCSDGRAGTT